MSASIDLLRILYRSTQVSLDSAHLHFIANFCCLKPLSVGKAHTLQAPPVKAVEMTLMVPRKPPTWLWTGYGSPTQLLRGSAEEKAATGGQEDLLWHPSMRIKQNVISLPIPRRNLATAQFDGEEESDQEKVSTPRGIMAELCARNAE